MNLISIESGVTITLKEITDMIDVEHNKAIKKIEKLAEEPEFGTIRKTRVVYNDKGQTTETIVLNKMQADAVLAILSFNKAKAQKKSNIIYLISDGEYIKIGKATGSATQRLKQLQTGNARKLYVLLEKNVKEADTIELELHELFFEKRMCGEWFDISKEDISVIKEILNA